MEGVKIKNCTQWVLLNVITGLKNQPYIGIKNENSKPNSILKKRRFMKSTGQ